MLTCSSTSADAAPLAAPFESGTDTFLLPCPERLLDFADRLDAEGVPGLARTVRRAASMPARVPMRCLKGI